MTLSVKRQSYAEALERNLTSLVHQLRRIPTVQKVILIGSFAAGRRDLFTDLDLVVVMDSPLDFVTRSAELGRQLQAEVALDLLVYTPDEIERMRERPFMRHALKTGKVLYERQPAP